MVHYIQDWSHPILDLKKKPHSERVLFRNIGAYTLSSQIEQQIFSANDLIDVIAIMYEMGELVVANTYLGVYLHIATLKDLDSWREYYQLNSGGINAK